MTDNQMNFNLSSPLYCSLFFSPPSIICSDVSGIDTGVKKNKFSRWYEEAGSVDISFLKSLEKFQLIANPNKQLYFKNMQNELEKTPFIL